LDIFQEKTCSDFSLQSKKKLAQLYKRTGKVNEAAHLWQQMAACEPVDLRPFRKLAKWLEHHERDYPQAKALIGNTLAGNNTFLDE